MSKPLTAGILLTLILFADLTAIRQTLSFWQKNQIFDDGFSLVALLACGVFIAVKSFAGKP